MTTTPDTYFFDVTTSVFDDYFQQLGAVRELSASPTTVRYSTANWFAEVFYLPFDGPKYSPRVAIGCRPERFGDPRRNRVDVMHTAPDDSEEYDYNLRWRFRSSQELRAALTAVRDRILAVYALPFLQDTNHLQMLLEQRRDFVETTWANEIEEHNESILRREAEAAFKSKDYGKVIQCYSKIPSERHSRIDELKLRIATSRVK